MESVMNSLLKYGRVTLAMVLTSVLLGLTAAPKVFAQSTNSQVYPPGHSVSGLSYGEWSAAWWKWLFAIPTGPGPDLNPQDQPSGTVDCSANQSGPVWFLAGSGSGQAVTRTCSSNISSTTSLIFPLINVECSTQDPAPFHCTDEASCRACAVRVIAGVNPRTLNVSINGTPVKNGVQAFRSQSPFFSFTVPGSHILNSP